MLHLLKWLSQPERRGEGRRHSINNARAEIEARLRRNPRLWHEVPEFLAWAYPKARRAAADETGLPRAMVPETCPWTLEQLQDEDFLPEERG